MTQRLTPARRRLREMLAAGSAYLDLGLAALLVGAEEEPEVDVERSLAALDDLAESLEPHLAEGSELQRVASLVEHLFVQQGFKGNGDDYGDPKNSYLHQVLERRIGIPITLSILLIEVGRRVGIELHGVGFPTHFLVGMNHQPGLFVDAFNEGRILTVDECKALLHVNTGGVLAYEPGYLAPTPTAEILARVSRNLRNLHLKEDRIEQALRAADRIVLLTPHDWVEVRERGLVHFRLGAYGAAIADFNTYITEVPEAPDRGWVEDLIEAGREHLS